MTAQQTHQEILAETRYMLSPSLQEGYRLSEHRLRVSWTDSGSEYGENGRPPDLGISIFRLQSRTLSFLEMAPSLVKTN